VIVAYGISHFNVEERFIHSTIESKITLVDNTAVESAARIAEGGDSTGAIEALKKELSTRPDNMDAAVALCGIARASEPPVLLVDLLLDSPCSVNHYSSSPKTSALNIEMTVSGWRQQPASRPALRQV
jgi:hypothetical protein